LGLSFLVYIIRNVTYLPLNPSYSMMSLYHFELMDTEIRQQVGNQETSQASYYKIRVGGGFMRPRHKRLCSIITVYYSVSLRGYYSLGGCICMVGLGPKLIIPNLPEMFGWVSYCKFFMFAADLTPYHKG
jgi:hypothetical protein